MRFLPTVLALCFLMACQATPKNSMMPSRESKPMMVDLSAHANRTAESPWAHQPPYGFRGWFEDDPFMLDGIPFQNLPAQKVVSLKQYESIEIELPAPKATRAIHVLCCASFLYEETLDFFVELNTAEGKELAALQAHEWYEPLDSIEGQRPYTVQLFPIFVDHHDGQGQIGVTSADVGKTVTSLRIINNSSNQYQHLLIAAITLE